MRRTHAYRVELYFNPFRTTVFPDNTQKVRMQDAVMRKPSGGASDHASGWSLQHSAHGAASPSASDGCTHMGGATSDSLGKLCASLTPPTAKATYATGRGASLRLARPRWYVR